MRVFVLCWLHLFWSFVRRKQKRVVFHLNSRSKKLFKCLLNVEDAPSEFAQEEEENPETEVLHQNLKELRQTAAQIVSEMYTYAGEITGLKTSFFLKKLEKLFGF